jgi:nucleoside-diphosphate-sugar epimerase
LRDYLHVDDAAEAIADTLHSRGQVSGQTFLVGSGSSISIREALEVIVGVAHQVVGLQSKILAKPVPPDAYPIEMRSVRINPDGFQRATGWKPRVTFEDGVRRLAIASARP